MSKRVDGSCSNLTCDQTLFFNKKGRRAPDPRLAATSSTVMRRMKKAAFRKVQNNAECASTTTMDFYTLILSSRSAIVTTSTLSEDMSAKNSETKIFRFPLTVETVILCTLMGETQIVERLTSGAAKITRLSPDWYNVGTSIDKDYKRTKFEGHVGEGWGWLVC